MYKQPLNEEALQAINSLTEVVVGKQKKRAKTRKRRRRKA
jgi:hypothetical protein